MMDRVESAVNNTKGSTKVQYLAMYMHSKKAQKAWEENQLIVLDHVFTIDIMFLIS